MCHVQYNFNECWKATEQVTSVMEAMAREMSAVTGRNLVLKNKYV